MDFTPDEDHEAIAEAVRRVCAGFDDDYWARCEADHAFPWDFYRRMAEGGWVGIAIPEAYGGGGGASPRRHRPAGGGPQRRGHERLLGAAPHHLRAQPGGPVRQPAAEEAFLPRAAAGDLHVAFGVTEPDAGTDTSRITTRAEPDGKGGWVVRGRKIWTTKALESEVVLLLVRTGGEGLRGLSLLLADLDPDHVDIRPIPKMGRNAVASCEVAYDGLPVPGWRLVGGGGPGLAAPAARPQPRAHPAGLGGDRHRRGGPRPGRGLRQGAGGVRPAHRRQPGHRAPAGPGPHPAGGGLAGGAARRLALRPGPRLRRGGPERQVPGRRGRLLRRRPGGADARRHGLRHRVPRRALVPGGPAPAHRARQPGR